MTTYATTQEFFREFEALPSKVKLALETYASRCAVGTHYSDSMDLIHEVFFRVLDGRRHWPRDVDLAAFLANSVKSLASSSRQLAEHKNVPLESIEHQEDGAEPMGHQPVSSTEELAMERERQRIAQAAVEFARSILQTDVDAIRVLNGIYADMTPKEMKQAFALSDKGFAAARQRVMFRLKSFAALHPH
ncbi:hypothetical protein DUPY_32540 [Duganella phyllosphaerae]|uniref:RNA polymerase sigma factor n=2 Tax=Duganella phyllosphaerae TaxID=762836 RepID=A0A1E7WH95_9BURK|nr:hypothetical protein DUPY_32540 [Duganella phyllosphaerae]